MLGEISIVISWAAFATFVTIVIAGLGAWGTIYWKISSHEKDNGRHLTGQDFVEKDVCDVTKNSLIHEAKETRKYIGDVEKRQSEATKTLKEDICQRLDELKSIWS